MMATDSRQSKKRKRMHLIYYNLLEITGFSDQILTVDVKEQRNLLLVHFSKQTHKSPFMTKSDGGNQKDILQIDKTDSCSEARDSDSSLGFLSFLDLLVTDLTRTVN
jgi:hypothetical protein